MPRTFTSTKTTITVIQSGLPAWVPAPGQFADASLDTPQGQGNVDPCSANDCVYSGAEGQSGLWNDWNGGCYAPLLGPYGSLVMFGGGHAGYFGNEVVTFDIHARTFRRLTEPALYGMGHGDWPNGDAPPSVVNAWGSYPDGTPYSFHTNMGADYLAPDAGGGALGSFVFISHDQTFVVCDEVCKIWRFDLATLSWSVSSVITKFNSGDGSQQRNALAYDSKRKGLWNLRFPSGGLSFYSFVTGIETDVPLNPGNSFFLYVGNMPAASLEYNAARDFLIAPFDDGTAKIACIDLRQFTLGTSGFAPTFVINQSGTPCPTIASPMERFAASSYDGHLYVLDWSSKTTAKLYKLTPPTDLAGGSWVWSNETLAAKGGEALAIAADRSTSATFYGRFRYVPAIKCFVWSDSSTLRAQAARPAAFL